MVWPMLIAAGASLASGVLSNNAQKDAQKAQRAAAKKANNALMEGYREGQGYLDRSADAWNPYIDSAGAGNALYANALGVNGAEGSQAAYDAYMGNPAFQAANQNALMALDKRYNAAGMADSGASRLAMSRAAVDQYGNWVDRLSGFNLQGMQATGAQSAVRAGQGEMAMGYGATRAGNYINAGNAASQGAQQSTNNLLGSIGTGIKAYTAFSGGK